MEIATRIRWLRAGAVIVIAFGVLIAAAAMPALRGPAELLLDLVYWPVDGAETAGGAAARLLSAITGGVMTGWGVMLWLIASELYPQRPALGRRIILLSVGSWFVVDSAMSVAAGAPLNALFNVGFLLIFVLPVWRPVAAGRDGAVAAH